MENSKIALSLHDDVLAQIYFHKHGQNIDKVVHEFIDTLPDDPVYCVEVGTTDTNITRMHKEEPFTQLELETLVKRRIKLICEAIQDLH